MGPTGRARVAVGLEGSRRRWRWGSWRCRMALSGGLFLEEGTQELRVRHLGGAATRAEVRPRLAEERLRLLPGRGLFGVFGRCRPDPDGRGAWIEPDGACRLAWERPAGGLQALEIWWRTEGGPWSLAPASRRFPTEAGLLRAAPAPEGRVSLRLSASQAPPPVVVDGGASLEGWRCRRGTCEGMADPGPEGVALGGAWLGASVLSIGRPGGAGGLRWGAGTPWDGSGMAEIVVENVGAEARQAPAPRLFGAVLEHGCAWDVVPGGRVLGVPWRRPVVPLSVRPAGRTLPCATEQRSVPSPVTLRWRR